MAVWPTGVSTDADLSILKNNLSTTLNGAIDAVTTTVVLTDASNFPTAGYVTIDSEAIKYTGKSTNTLTGVTRGADNTTAATHSDAAPVLHLFIANHHNALKDEIKAIETSLDLTASRAVVTDGSGRVSAATTTSTEIGYVNGVTSAIQTQINAKAPAASPTFSGTITTPLTASRALVTGASSELAVAATTSTEIGYVNGVTSAIQTQLDTKISAPSVYASSSSGAQSFTTAVETDVTNCSVSVTVPSGRSVYVALVGDTSTTGSYCGITATGQLIVKLYRNSTAIATNLMQTATQAFPHVSQLDVSPGAGTYTYKATGQNQTNNAAINYCRLIAFIV